MSEGNTNGRFFIEISDLTKKPEVKFANWRVFFLVIAWMLFSSSMTHLCDAEFQYQQSAQVEPTKDELTQDFIIGTTKAGFMVIKWSSHQDIADRCGNNAEACTIYTTSWPYNCTIYLPIGMSIIAHPNDQLSAMWMQPMMNETIAHEMLHCLRGKWHQTWDEHNLAQGRQ